MNENGKLPNNWLWVGKAPHGEIYSNDEDRKFAYKKSKELLDLVEDLDFERAVIYEGVEGKYSYTFTLYNDNTLPSGSIKFQGDESLLLEFNIRFDKGCGDETLSVYLDKNKKSTKRYQGGQLNES